jgi:hypothetical protein
MEDRPIAAYFIAFGVAVIVCIPAIIDWACTINIRAATRRRSRYFWALSFWDVGQARKILSGVPNPIPSSAVFVDLALMTSLFAVCFVTWWRGYDKSSHSLWLVELYITVLPAASAIPCSFRLTCLISLRLQWYFSTFEYRTDGQTSPRVKLALRFISTSLQANFQTQIISLIAILVFVLFYALVIDTLKTVNLVEEAGANIWMLVILILFIVYLAIILCIIIRVLVSGTYLIVQDTRRRIQWMYEGNSAVSQGASSRNIQLV